MHEERGCINIVKAISIFICIISMFLIVLHFVPSYRNAIICFEDWRIDIDYVVSYEGVIISKKTKNPVQGCMIKIGGYQSYTRTNSDGEFSIRFKYTDPTNIPITIITPDNKTYTEYCSIKVKGEYLLNKRGVIFIDEK